MRNHTEPALNTDLHSAIKLLRGGYTLKPVVQCVNWDTCFDEMGRGVLIGKLTNAIVAIHPLKHFVTSCFLSNRQEVTESYWSFVDFCIVISFRFLLLLIVIDCCHSLSQNDMIQTYPSKIRWANSNEQNTIYKYIYSFVKTHLSKIRWAKTAKNWRLSQVLPRLVTLLPEKIIIVF